MESYFFTQSTNSKDWNDFIVGKKAIAYGKEINVDQPNLGWTPPMYEKIIFSNDKIFSKAFVFESECETIGVVDFEKFNYIKNHFCGGDVHIVHNHHRYKECLGKVKGIKKQYFHIASSYEKDFFNNVKEFENSEFFKSSKHVVEEIEYNVNNIDSKDILKIVTYIQQYN